MEKFIISVNLKSSFKNGHAFETHSDTEVLLHAYLEWKEDCVQHLNGISLSPYGMIKATIIFSVII